MDEWKDAWLDGWINDMSKKNSFRHTKCRKKLSEFSMESFKKCLWMDEILWNRRNLYMKVGIDGMLQNSWNAYGSW